MPVIDINSLLHQLLYDPANPLLFNSGFFVYFFAAFICLYYAVRHLPMGRSIVVSLFSLYFFYKASGYFVGLVIIAAIIDYLISNQIYRTNDKIKRKLLLAVSVIFNLGMLFYFKYTNFFIALCNQTGAAHFSPLNILLPVGISFYTFENLSYTIDVYKKEFVPEKNFLNYLLFLSFFPKLVMGPIVRAKDFIPQLHKPYYVSREDFGRGFLLICNGLFKKLVISDFLTTNFVNYIFDDPGRYTGLECTFAVLGYAIVIYCDFSGYSDVAIGIAKWLGIHIPPNFNLPYLAKSAKEFWKRWHISLSSWLQDYLYIFWLGGNRKGKGRTYVNLLITMLLGGLWHGASVTFVVWGAIHGTGLIIHRLWESATGKRYPALNNHPIYSLLSGLLTFSFVCFAWIFFKATTFGAATTMITKIATDWNTADWAAFYANYHAVLWMMALGYALHFAHLLPLRAETKQNIAYLFQSKAPMAAYVLIFIAFLLIYAQFKSATPVMPIYLRF
jgi:alginate O-acetyltransferase complex protein AlgI